MDSSVYAIAAIIPTIIKEGITMKIYGMKTCGDCIAMQAEFNEKQISYEFIEITESPALMKEFLALRDTDSVFEEVRKEHRIGVPCFVLSTGRLTLDIAEAKADLGVE